MGEGARRLAGPCRRIDPARAEELSADIGQLGRESAVGSEHDLLRLGPRDGPVVVLGQRRVPVPVRHLVDAEPLGLELVVAVRQPRIGRLHRRDERVHHLVLDHVGEVHCRLRMRVLAPAILDLLVLGQRVGDQREDRDIVALHLAEGLGGVLADGRILARKLVQDLRLAERLVAERIAQPRDGLVEQARPRGTPHHVFLVQRLLELVGELVRAEHAQVAQPRAVFGERRILLLGGEVGVVELVDLEPKEHQLGADIGQALGNVLRKAAALRIGLILRVIQRGVGTDAAHQVLQRFVARDGRAQRLAVHRGDLALAILGKGLGVLGSALEVGFEIGAGRAGIEVGQLPGRQVAQHSIH